MIDAECAGVVVRNIRLVHAADKAVAFNLRAGVNKILSCFFEARGILLQAEFNSRHYYLIVF